MLRLLVVLCFPLAACADPALEAAMFGDGTPPVVQPAAYPQTYVPNLGAAYAAGQAAAKGYVPPRPVYYPQPVYIHDDQNDLTYCTPTFGGGFVCR
jgi:hypothetical protein